MFEMLLNMESNYFLKLILENMFYSIIKKNVVNHDSLFFFKMEKATINNFLPIIISFWAKRSAFKGKIKKIKRFFEISFAILFLDKWK